MSEAPQRPEGSILVRIDGRLDAIDRGAPLWKQLLDHIDGSMREFPDSPVYIDLRKVLYANPRCVQILDEVMDDIRKDTTVVFLGPGPGLETMYAATGDFFIKPLRMFAPWEEEELTGVATPEALPDKSTLGAQPGAQDNIAAALDDILDEADEAVDQIPAYEEPACFQPLLPRSMTDDTPQTSEGMFEINLDIEKAHLDSSADGHDHSSRDLFHSRRSWESPSISTSWSPHQPIDDAHGAPDPELLQTLARLEKSNRELRAKQREQETRVAREQREAEIERQLAEKERRRVHEEGDQLRRQAEEERRQAEADLAAREQELDRERIAAARAAADLQERIDQELRAKQKQISRQEIELETKMAVESYQQQRRLDEIHEEKSRVTQIAQQRQEELEEQQQLGEMRLKRLSDELDQQRTVVENRVARERAALEEQRETLADEAARERNSIDEVRSEVQERIASARRELDHHRDAIAKEAEEELRAIEEQRSAVEQKIAGELAELDETRMAIEKDAAEKHAALEARAEELDRREAELFEISVPNTAENWLEGARVGTAEGVVLREEFLGLIERFTSQGFVDPDEVAAFTLHLDTLAADISVNLARLLPRGGAESRDAHWGAMLILTSTLVREDSSPNDRKVALTAAILGTLVLHAPGCQPQSGVVGHDIEEHVVRLLESGFCQLESGFSEEHVRLELAVWRAGLKIASADQLTPHTWGQALSQMLANLEPVDPACQGLPRILSTHSVFMPGAWVELSNGIFGQVVGASNNQPERPRVMLLFEIHNERTRAIPPRMFPQEDEVDVTVVRVLDENEFVSLGSR